jgi:sigma-B regulation protein RsbU (phosphoserine phosphatase)
MQVAMTYSVRDQLMDRRRRLETAPPVADVAQLLEAVDRALSKIDEGTFGLCETCHDPVEADRLIADPLVRFCLDHLTAGEQRALEQDLELAARIQRELLPKTDRPLDGWDIAYEYRPAGPVSGDYVDVIHARDGGVFFFLGDVSGKGIAASMLMAHLHAMFRTLTSLSLPLDQLVERASRVFCESTLPTHYATLVTGRADATGAIEISNAGHPPAFILNGGSVHAIEATGMPIGVFSNERFQTVRTQLAPGDALLLYSDGASEARDSDGGEYGRERLRRVLAEHAGRDAKDIVRACVSDVTTFARNAVADDLTVMAVRRR